MYVYHTDQTGEYGGDRESGPRLKGWMVTGAEGRYEYATIRPASYPGNRFAAHVHVQFWGNGVPPQFANDLLFEDDPLVREAERERSRALGEFGFVRRGELRGGVLRITHNFRLKERGDRFEESVLHGRRACKV
jgi:protocatechuate 3,4-dioxygenase beta subunit